jgi:hypothetical protein
MGCSNRAAAVSDLGGLNGGVLARRCAGLAGECGQGLDGVNEACEAAGGGEGGRGDGLLAGGDEAVGELVTVLAGLDDGGELAGEHEDGQADVGRAELAAGIGGHGAGGRARQRDQAGGVLSDHDGPGGAVFPLHGVSQADRLGVPLLLAAPPHPRRGAHAALAVFWQSQDVAGGLGDDFGGCCHGGIVARCRAGGQPARRPGRAAFTAVAVAAGSGSAGHGPDGGGASVTSEGGDRAGVPESTAARAVGGFRSWSGRSAARCRSWSPHDYDQPVRVGKVVHRRSAPSLARPPSPGLLTGAGPGGGLLAAAETASQASAHIARVTCRYHAVCLRTW